jgi:16S rRNA (guanine527-N7)-methyltransferase
VTAPDPASGGADVSRETVRRQVFGAGYDRAVDYEHLLRTAGVDRGLVGPREAGRMWERHLLNSAVIAPAIPTGSTLVDVGTGAGLPGIPLALARPDLTVVLVEPLLRRTVFLAEVIEALELDQVRVVRGRAEDLAGEVTGDAVTARAVAPLERLAGWCLPLARPGGSLLAIKGAQAEEELAAAAPGLARLGATSWTVETYGVGLVDPAVRVVRVVRSGSAGRPPRPTDPGAAR